MKENSVVIDGVEYIPKAKAVVFETGESSSLSTSFIGEYVIVRSRSEGINAGTVVTADESGVLLKNCRRLWYHEPLDKTLSWYEGVAISGLSENSKISTPVLLKLIIEDYSIISVSEVAIKSITEFAAHAQE